MTMKKVMNGVVTAVKWGTLIYASGSILQSSVKGAQMLENDVEATIKFADSKINPKTMKRRWFLGKRELYDVRRQKFVADLKKPANKAKKSK